MRYFTRHSERRRMQRSGIRRSGETLSIGKRPFASLLRPVFFIIAALVLFCGCNPYQFTMGGPHMVTCYILTSLPGVDHDEYMATLRDTATLDLNYYGATQYLLTMGIRVRDGQGFRILLRPAVEHRDIPDSGIIVIATPSGVMLEDSGRIFLTRPDIPLPKGQPVRVALLSENNYYQVVVGCDTVIRGWTKRMESDDVVVQALQASTVDVIHPDWAPVPDSAIALPNTNGDTPDNNGP